MVARQVRDLLDELGARDTRIVLSGDLNEYSIAALAAAPVDGYGVGTSLVTGSGAPTAALVYKLVARARQADGGGTLEPVAKRSVGKPGRGGRKWAFRQFDTGGVAATELITRTDPVPAGVAQRPLLRPLVQGGEITGPEPLDTARERHRAALAELPVHALQLSRGYPAIPTVFTPPDDE
jgi:nicotinate phosphoribosyltransferase